MAKFKKFPFAREYLRERVAYDKITGIFTWKRHPEMPATWNGRWADKAAGSLDPITGYVHIRIDGKNYLAHRLAWFYVYGEQPPEVDHKNLNKTNNWISNLRKDTNKQNQHNRTANKNNTSGYKGVCKAKGGGWRAQIQIRTRIIHLGTYASPEKAHEIYVQAAKKYHGLFARWGASESETAFADSPQTIRRRFPRPMGKLVV